MVQTISFQPTTDQGLLDAYSNTVSSVAQSASDSVVHIIVNKEVTNRQTKQKQSIPGSGSGFIISSDGYIVTNHHVVEDSKSIRVILTNGLEVNAQLCGKDPSTDIAVIKIHEYGLKSLQFADSKQLKPGQIAMSTG